MTEAQTCSVAECERPAKKRGWCYTHYNRWQYSGSPTHQFAPITDQAAARASLDALSCPYCGRGPFRVVAGHVQRAHGIDRRQLREDAGLAWSVSICDPDHAAHMRDLSIENDQVAHMRGKHREGVRNPMSPAGRSALAEAGRHSGRAFKIAPESHAEIRLRYQRGESAPAIARDYGCSSARVRQIAAMPGQA